MLYGHVSIRRIFPKKFCEGVKNVAKQSTMNIQLMMDTFMIAIVSIHPFVVDCFATIGYQHLLSSCIVYDQG